MPFPTLRFTIDFFGKDRLIWNQSVEKIVLEKEPIKLSKQEDSDEKREANFSDFLSGWAESGFIFSHLPSGIGSPGI